MPADRNGAGALADRQFDVDTADDPVCSSVSNRHDGGVLNRRDDRLPDLFAVLNADVEDPLPVLSVAALGEDPVFELDQLVPGLVGARQPFSNNRWPGHQAIVSSDLDAWLLRPGGQVDHSPDSTPRTSANSATIRDRRSVRRRASESSRR